ncbi:MAG: carboxylesterase family protein, partial [Parasporobacterium sp.]|nr:carboxylesterase family protein [Parasporobacterium sp.]
MKNLDIVQTKYGKVSGIGSDRPDYDGITYFRGIPYAAPPVGALRWRPPADPKPWEGVRVCGTYAPMAMQNMGSGPSFEPWATDFYYMGNPEDSEDCLYLNITTAAKAAGEKRPVYMWFHGGGLSTGYSYEIEFDGSELAKRGLVVVTVGQRLNVFGYLSCRQLSEEQGGISGNYGLMDEIKALDWVYENIEAFGGDPENITVGGQSGGTSKTGALAASPFQKGWVKRVIHQSALNWNVKYQTVKEAEESARVYFKAIGLDPDISLEELRRTDPAVLLKPLPWSFEDTKAARTPGSMVYDGLYIDDPDQAVSFRKYAAGCDFLSGVTCGEGAMKKGFFLGGQKAVSREEFYSRAKELLGEALYKKYDFENLVPVTDDSADRVSRMLAARGLT